MASASCLQENNIPVVYVQFCVLLMMGAADTQNMYSALAE